MKIAELNDQPEGYLEPKNGRVLATAAHVLKHHGYTHLADEINELAQEILKKPKA